MKNTNEDKILSILQPDEIKSLYAISRLIAQVADPDVALDRLIRHIRSVFIFDNLVIYQPRENQVLEPTYARAIGRGRSKEADLAWGEAIATDTYEKADTIVRREALEGFTENRLQLRYFIGLPLQASEYLMGSIVFIRFGGPPYLPDQIRLAEIIAGHIAQLLERQHFIRRIASLEADRRLNQLFEDFIATVSHDLRTPLGFIKGYATTLLREDTGWDEETYREFLAIIDEEADRLGELIDNLLDSSRLQAGTLQMNFQPIHLEKILTEVVQRSKVSDYQFSIRLNIEPGKTIVRADPTRLNQVFDNLLSNAAKYAPDSLVSVSMNIKNDKVHIIFQDTGPGIPSEHLEKIFERFFRVPDSDSSIHGSGLGLFICRQIIAAHRGEIYAESDLGKGTAFHILLPRQKQ